MVPFSHIRFKAALFFGQKKRASPLSFFFCCALFFSRAVFFALVARFFSFWEALFPMKCCFLYFLTSNSVVSLIYVGVLSLCLLKKTHALARPVFFVEIALFSPRGGFLERPLLALIFF